MQQTIIPFEATHYNPKLFPKLPDLICPPYDVITKEQLKYFQNKSLYNFSNILLAANSNYKTLVRRFFKWLKDKILIDDDEKSLYFYLQHFKYDNKKYQRLGIISLLCMDKKGLIFPHENTLAKPKKDRKKIIENMKANLTPIFVVIPRRLNIFFEIYNSLKNKPPFLKFKDFENNDNLVWKISDEKSINKICRVFQNKKLIIADGHHRFEVAYEYYLKHKNDFSKLNYILAYITDAQEGLMVLPTHRIVSVLDTEEVFFKKLSDNFDIKNVSETKLEQLLSKKKNFCFGIYASKKFYFSELRNKSKLNVIENIYRELDTYLLNHLVLALFKINGDIIYTHSMKEVRQLTGSKRVAFILRPISVKNIFKIASCGYTLPQKSTYFYPKIPSGILLRRFIKDENI
ncbi:MAG: DUF1015 domain-containing protein [Candidatus Omnitrophica bacterium]|nr:DUF1015 domain-containing protein [Candidatus Omnitrophota bacterium]